MYLSASFAANAHAAMTNRMLNTADPTMVPMPTSFFAKKMPMIEVNSSGAEPPAAMNVAPATSGVMPSWMEKEKREKGELYVRMLLSFTNIISGR